MEKSILSLRAKNIAPSPTLAVDSKAKSLKAQGKDVCGLGAGEPDFDTPSFIKEACKRALDNGKTKYVPVAGIPDLRQALSQWYKENRKMNVDPSQIILSPGGKYSCYLAILAICSFGDEVIIPAPYWVSYPEMVKLSGASPVYIQAKEDNDFKITAEQLEETITEKTKLLIFNSPSNPTGTVYSKEEVEAVMNVCKKHNVFVMSDEIYEFLLYDNATHTSPASIAGMEDLVITVTGFSKSYAMTGWRMGTTVAPKIIADAIINLQSQTCSNVTSFAQFGALEIFNQPEKAKEAISEMLEVFDRRRLLFYNGLNSIKGLSCRRANGAFYLFPNVTSFGLTSTQFASKLLDDELVALVPGIAFGADDNVRVSYATSDEIIEKALERIDRFCSKL